MFDSNGFSASVSLSVSLSVSNSVKFRLLSQFQFPFPFSTRNSEFDSVSTSASGPIYAATSFSMSDIFSVSVPFFIRVLCSGSIFDPELGSVSISSYIHILISVPVDVYVFFCFLHRLQIIFGFDSNADSHLVSHLVSMDVLSISVSINRCTVLYISILDSTSDALPFPFRFYFRNSILSSYAQIGRKISKDYHGSQPDGNTRMLDTFSRPITSHPVARILSPVPLASRSHLPPICSFHLRANSVQVVCES